MGRDLDEHDLFEKEEAARRMAHRAELQRVADEERKKEEDQRAIARAAALERKRVGDGQALLRQYHANGVEPISVDGDGFPTVSYSMLMRMGWWVEKLEGENRLVGPQIVKQERQEDESRRRD